MTPLIRLPGTGDTANPVNPKQLAYEAQRRAFRQQNPNREVTATEEAK